MNMQRPSPLLIAAVIFATAIFAPCVRATQGHASPACINADPCARALLAYLHSISGNYVLSGQQEGFSDSRSQMETVRKITGKLPAVRGFEMMTSAVDPTEEAIRSWLIRRQLVTLSWHMGAPPLPDSGENSRKTVAGGIDELLTPGTPLHADFRARLDEMAARLQRLRLAGVPVLWRPFHEMNAEWFWWGKHGPSAYVRLWRFVFDYFTQEKQLRNLLWVWSTPAEVRHDWYPGDEYVDIVGCDTYFSAPQPIAKWSSIYQDLKRIVGDRKPIALTENDIIPSPQVLLGTNTNFVWFLTWRDDWLRKNKNPVLKEIYNQGTTITADELPDLSRNMEPVRLRP